MLCAGTKLTAAHFVPGQYVDVYGRTMERGFQGNLSKFLLPLQCFQSQVRIRIRILPSRSVCGRVRSHHGARIPRNKHIPILASMDQKLCLYPGNVLVTRTDPDPDPFIIKQKIKETLISTVLCLLYDCIPIRIHMFWASWIRIRIRQKEVRIRGSGSRSGSVPKCQGSTTLAAGGHTVKKRELANIPILNISF